jgi:anthranilate phosphoribosyltransferase
VHAEIGMDEISPRGSTAVWEVRPGRVDQWQLDPAAVGLAVDDLGDLAGHEPADNARRIRQLLDGNGTPATRAAVLLNAAAALYVAGLGLSYGDAVEAATRALQDGQGGAALERLVRVSNEPPVTSGG